MTRLIPLNLSYLGNRDYIDVTSITRAVSAAIDPNIEQSQISDFSIHMENPLLNECFLVPKNSREEALTRVAKVRFNYRDNFFDFDICQNETPIARRSMEAKIEILDYCKLEQDRILLQKPFSTEFMYTLMSMGKAILVSHFRRPPRVVKMQYECFFNPALASGVSMKIGPLNRMNFGQLICEKGGEPFGSVLVKLLSP